MSRSAAAWPASRWRARQAATPAFSPQDPPVTLGQMALWLSLPIAGTVMLVLFTGRRRKDELSATRRP